MLAEVGRVGVAPAEFLMYLIKSQVLKCRPRLTIPMKKETSPCEYGLATYYSFMTNQKICCHFSRY